MKVMKFGGSSVGSAANIKRVAAIVKASAASGGTIVVVSAMQGITDLLIEAGHKAEKGNAAFVETIAAISDKHVATATQLFGGELPAQFTQLLEASANELKEICEGVRLVRELSPRTLDRILSFGEMASSRILSEFLTSLEVSNVWKDSRELILTDSNFGFAAVELNKTYEQIKNFISRESKGLFILPGFIARDADGAATTLGRGGSDYTAAIVAAGLDADVLEIWTDVPGMMTADPRFVRNVRHISRVTYREAMELSHFGAKVIYPPTIQPVMARGIPLLIKNTFEPDAAGTLIEADAHAGEMIRGISSIDNIAVLNLEGSGMVGIPGFSKRLFEALSRSQINVILITQSSSEHSICVAIEEKFGKLAKTIVDREFESEIGVGKIEPLRVDTGYSILALVGDRMREHTGVSGRMFSSLGQNGINIHAIAQGSSERNISAIISSADVRKAVNTLHEEFFSDGSKQVNLFIAGVGTVGSRLFEQLRQQRDHLHDRLRLNVRVVALSNSKAHVIDEDGLDLANWREILDGSATPGSGREIAELILSMNLRNSIFVDVTANPQLIDIYPQLLERSVSVIACNKVACSSEYETYTRLKDLAREYNTNFLFETNVGAGLPVINTLNDLLRSGDRLRRIEAVLSGTLNFVFNNYDGSRSFSSVVRQAQTEGYTEPDPRLDLNGTDVARKILILAREAGHRLEMADVKNASFLPESCLAGNVEDFYTEMERNEEHFFKLLEGARAEGKKLKYIATFDQGRASVGLQSISPDHDFANLSGKDNAVLFYTDRYSEQPLVIKGAGAGADVTAAGVFADIIRAAR